MSEKEEKLAREPTNMQCHLYDCQDDTSIDCGKQYRAIPYALQAAEVGVATQACESAATIKILRSAKDWMNDGECCGQKDCDGVCAAPACTFGTALLWFHKSADEIEALIAACDALRAENERLKSEVLAEREACARIADVRAEGFHTGECECGHVEWDTNAFVCSNRNGCLCQEREEEAEAIASAIRSRAALSTKEPK